MKCIFHIIFSILTCKLPVQQCRNGVYQHHIAASTGHSIQLWHWLCESSTCTPLCLGTELWHSCLCHCPTWMLILEGRAAVG